MSDTVALYGTVLVNLGCRIPQLQVTIEADQRRQILMMFMKSWRD